MCSSDLGKLGPRESGSWAHKSWTDASPPACDSTHHWQHMPDISSQGVPEPSKSPGPELYGGRRSTVHFVRNHGDGKSSSLRPSRAHAAADLSARICLSHKLPSNHPLLNQPSMDPTLSSPQDHHDERRGHRKGGACKDAALLTGPGTMTKARQGSLRAGHTED